MKTACAVIPIAAAANAQASIAGVQTCEAVMPTRYPHRTKIRLRLPAEVIQPAAAEGVAFCVADMVTAHESRIRGIVRLEAYDANRLLSKTNIRC